MTLKKVFLTTMIIALAGSLFLAAVILFAFRIETVQIEGNKRVSNEEIESMIRLDKARGNSFLLYMLNRKQERKDHILVKSIEVSLDTPGNVLVNVNEEVPVACAEENGKYAFFNNEGIVLFKKDKTEEGIPVVSGVTITVPAEGEKLESPDEELLDELVNTAAVLNECQVALQELVVSQTRTYSGKMGTINILLGNTDHMKEKAQEIVNLSEQLKGLSGTLHLDYYDLSAQTVVFSKDEPETETEEEEETAQDGYGDEGDDNGEEPSWDENSEGSEGATQWDGSDGGSDGSYDYEGGYNYDNEDGDTYNYDGDNNYYDEDENNYSYEDENNYDEEQY